ncbi:MAG: sigma-70 family RNA polymerase sigma factor [Planctomycetota bacterium]
MEPEGTKVIFDAWFRRHERLLFKVLRVYARTPDDREDLLQEISLQLWRSLPHYNGEVAETTWTYRVAMYTAISWLRKERVPGRRVPTLGDGDRLLQDTAAPADPRMERLLEAVERLDAFDRSLAILMLDGCSYKEMSAVLGVTENHVGVKVNRLKQKLIRTVGGG